MNYYYSDDLRVEGTYIIRIKGNEVSERLAQKSLKSCQRVGQPNPILIDAFDATHCKSKKQQYHEGKPVGEIQEIKVPDFLKDQAFINFLRLKRSDLLITQIACFLSHYSLWCMCLSMDRPIVILEHDAIMVKPYGYHSYYNNIVYLGGREQKQGTMPYNNTTIPPWASDQHGLDRFICRAHAYSIDPAIAKNLVSYSIQHGIITTADAIQRCDTFGIVQDDVYAYDEHEGYSTINENSRPYIP